MTRHLGADVVAALVDGELADDERERALAHLAGCAPCRAEVDAQRRFKARLRTLGPAGPAPDRELLDRLLALGPVPPAPEPHPQLADRLRGTGATGSGTAASAARVARPRAPGAGSRPIGVRRRALARTAVGGAALAAGVGAVLYVGGRPAPGPAPVDPRSDVLLVDHAGTAGELVVGVPVGRAPRR